MMTHRRTLTAALVTTVVLGAAAVALPGAATASGAEAPVPLAPIKPALTTPIKHIVVIFDENVSFDHYFGTYPKA